MICTTCFMNIDFVWIYTLKKTCSGRCFCTLLKDLSLNGQSVSLWRLLFSKWDYLPLGCVQPARHVIYVHVSSRIFACIQFLCKLILWMLKCIWIVGCWINEVRQTNPSVTEQLWCCVFPGGSDADFIVSFTWLFSTEDLGSGCVCDREDGWLNEMWWREWG